MKKLLKTALYVRCASKEQNKPSSIESQLNQRRKVCKDSQIVKKYVDEGRSGMNLNRPGLKQLLRDAENGLFDTLYVCDATRLSRNPAQFIKILNELGRKGVKVNFLNPNDALRFSILLTFADYERKLRSEATKKGIVLAKKKKQRKLNPTNYRN